MSLVINHNLMAMDAARNLGISYNNLSTSVSRLSSGLRINSAADDAAGLAIREMMRTDIRVLNQGVRNANDAMSLRVGSSGPPPGVTGTPRYTPGRQARPRCRSLPAVASVIRPGGQYQGEGGHADCDVFGAVGSRGAVTHPFSGSRMNALAGLHGHLAAFGLHDQGAAQHDRELVELRALPGLGPARRAAHVSDAQAVLARVRPSDVLVDQLGRLASRGDPARLLDQFRHSRQYPAVRVTPDHDPK